MQSALPQAQCMPTTGQLGSAEAHKKQGAGLGLQPYWNPGLSWGLSSFLLLSSPFWFPTALPILMLTSSYRYSQECTYAHMLMSMCLYGDMHMLAAPISSPQD